MNQENTPLDDIKVESSIRGKDKTTRTILIILLCLWLTTLVALVVVAWNAYFGAKAETETLAQQIALACQSGTIRPPEFSKEDEEAMCKNAEKVIEDSGEIQEGEIQEREIQEPETQDPEFQDPELQNKEKQDAELQELESEDSEIQDPEIQDPEIDDPENQDPEIDDPDPADDDVTGGSCSFDGMGTIVFTLQTDSGPVTFECTGTQGPGGLLFQRGQK